MPSRSVRAARACATILSALITLAASRAGAQQTTTTDYDHTTFVHGTGSGPEIWTSTYIDIGYQTPPSYLSRQVDIRIPNYPNLDASKRYADEVVNLKANLISVQGNMRSSLTASAG